VEADFAGGEIVSDAGALLLGEVEKATDVVDNLSRCFTDHRDPERIEHSVKELLAQRIFGIALGYEDLVDHDILRCDQLLATLVGKVDPSGQDRRRAQDRGAALAGKSTLSRLELTPENVTDRERYKKITHDPAAIERFFVDTFLEAHLEDPKEIVLDFDATDFALHGKQEHRFFHGYYDSYCYLPLYVFCGKWLLAAKLRPSNIDGSAGTVEILEWLIPRIQKRWPKARIIVRGDSGFAREAIMAWCEKHGVHFVVGLARNERLLKRIEVALASAKEQFEQTREPARVFEEFGYRTRSTWSRKRRVIAKAEHLAKGPNPRFIVTSLPANEVDARTMYEAIYCARGEMENRIKEKQLFLFADRMSCHRLRENQLRLWFSSAAYVLLQFLREDGLRGTEFANAQIDTIRLKLLKIGAIVRLSVRRVLFNFSSSFPYRQAYREIYRNLQAAYAPPA
jgi:hypothetical protein